MKPGFEPQSFKSYNLTPEKWEQQELFIKENMKKGYIQPLKSPMASSFFFFLKKDRWLWPTQDYQYLNQWTVKNAHPLSLISDIMDKNKASGAKYFTKFDIWWDYNSVWIEEGDQWKVAFKTNMGLFEPTIMFFGLCNSPATFQVMMNDILKDELNEGWVIVYMDDILIFSKTKDKLEEMTKQVLQQLWENDLYLKPNKYKFCKTRCQCEYCFTWISPNQCIIGLFQLFIGRLLKGSYLLTGRLCNQLWKREILQILTWNMFCTVQKDYNRGTRWGPGWRALDD